MKIFMENIKKIIFFILLCFGIVFLSWNYKDVIANYIHNQQQSVSKPLPVKVSTRIKWFAYASYIGTYVAKDWGIWSDLGLDVSIYEGGPQVDALKLVANGTNDFGITGGDQLIVARSKGLPVVAIAALMQSSPAGFMVHEDSDIKSMKDFAGKKIRIIPGHNTEIEYRAVMNKLGIKTSSLTEVVNLTELQLFLQNQVDIEPVYLNNQPSKVRSLGIPFRVFSPTDYGVHSYGNVYFTTEKMIKEHPEIVQKFLEGELKGWKGAFDNPDHAVKSLLKYSKTLVREIELDKLKNTFPLMYRDDGRIGWMEKSRWEEITKFLQETKIIDKPVNSDEVFSNVFLEKIYANKI